MYEPLRHVRFRRAVVPRQPVAAFSALSVADVTAAIHWLPYKQCLAIFFSLLCLDYYCVSLMFVLYDMLVALVAFCYL